MSGRWIPSQRRRKHTQKLPQLRKAPASQGVGPIHKADCVCVGCRAIRDDAETRKRSEKPATYSTHTQDANRLLRIAADGSRAELMPDGTLVPLATRYKTGGVSSTLNGWTISTDSGLFSSIEITETFCSADAPEGFTNPGFLANFTLGSGDCEDCTGCVGFGTDGAECPPAVDPCCEADTLPDPLTVELNSGAYSFTLPQTGFTAGAAVWAASLTVDGCPIGFSVTQTCPDGFVVEMLDDVMTPASDTVTATSCSPLDINSAIDLSATARCLPAITQISITA